MRTKDFVTLERRLLTTLADFTVKGHLLFIVPVGHTLRGFHFDGSSFDKKSFYVNAFLMPLCVPTKHIHLTFGRRIRHEHGERWNTDGPHFEAVLESAVQKEVPFLVSLKTAKDVAKVLEPLTRGSNPHCHEAFAYVLLQAGETQAAVNAIDGLLRLVDSIKRVNPSVTWELEIAARAETLKDKVMRNPEEARAQLSEWTSETVRNLGLENFWSGSNSL